jgi:hypothetical protein
LNVSINLLLSIFLFDFVCSSANPHVDRLESIQYHNIIVIQIILLEVVNFSHMDISSSIRDLEQSWCESWCKSKFFHGAVFSLSTIKTGPESVILFTFFDISVGKI